MSNALPLPHPYLPGDQKPDSFEAKTQQNMDALAIAVGELRANTSWSQRPQARAYNSANISVVNGGTGTYLTFDSEVFDIGGMHSTSANTGRLTCVTPGLYSVIGYVGYAANATGTRVARLDLNRTSIFATEERAANGANAVFITVAGHIRLAAGDYVEVFAFQTSGGALNVSAASGQSPYLSAAWLSP